MIDAFEILSILFTSIVLMILFVILTQKIIITVHLLKTIKKDSEQNKTDDPESNNIKPNSKTPNMN